MGENLNTILIYPYIEYNIPIKMNELVLHILRLKQRSLRQGEKRSKLQNYILMAPFSVFVNV